MSEPLHDDVPARSGAMSRLRRNPSSTSPDARNYCTLSTQISVLSLRLGRLKKDGDTAWRNDVACLSFYPRKRHGSYMFFNAEVCLHCIMISSFNQYTIPTDVECSLIPRLA
jgi:hypothetical protein